MPDAPDSTPDRATPVAAEPDRTAPTEVVSAPEAAPATAQHPAAASPVDPSPRRRRGPWIVVGAAVGGLIVLGSTFAGGVAVGLFLDGPARTAFSQDSDAGPGQRPDGSVPWRDRVLPDGGPRWDGPGGRREDSDTESPQTPGDEPETNG